MDIEKGLSEREKKEKLPATVPATKRSDVRRHQSCARRAPQTRSLTCSSTRSSLIDVLVIARRGMAHPWNTGASEYIRALGAVREQEGGGNQVDWLMCVRLSMGHGDGGYSNGGGVLVVMSRSRFVPPGGSGGRGRSCSSGRKYAGLALPPHSGGVDGFV
jgi:hypothetical protein